MKIIDSILNRFRDRDAIVNVNYGQQVGSLCLTTEPFARVLFLNVCDILTDLCNDVTFVNVGGRDNMLFADFKTFFERNGQFVMNRLFDNGYEIIGHDARGFRILRDSEYYMMTDGDVTTARPNDPQVSVYVMRSQTYRLKGLSDAAILRPFLNYADNVLNSSNTTRAQLGAFIIGSPKTYSGAPAPVPFKDKDKEKLEEEIGRKYGSNSKQRHVMLTQQEMSWTTISLAGLDKTTNDDLKTAILAICDRIKVPANQVAIINSDSSKTLANGSEQREGDFAKYQSFERLLNHTFVEMAREIGLKVDYQIYNKPTRDKVTA